MRAIRLPLVVLPLALMCIFVVGLIGPAWAAGALDPTFGTAGKVTTDFFGAEDQAHGVAVQADGKIVAAGYALNGSHDDFALARYNADGSLDPTFGGAGTVTTDFFGNGDQANAVAIQGDGKIVAAGLAVDGFTGNFALARYNADGSLDPAFGTGGEGDYGFRIRGLCVRRGHSG